MTQVEAGNEHRHSGEPPKTDPFSPAPTGLFEPWFFTVTREQYYGIIEKEA